MARLTIGVRDTGVCSTRGTGKGGLLAESARPRDQESEARPDRKPLDGCCS